MDNFKRLLEEMNNYKQEADANYSPYAMAHIQKRLIRAITKKEKILIFGDKDADGIFSSIIMKAYLQRAYIIMSDEDRKGDNSTIDIQYSNRELDGFGLSKERYEEFSKEYDLIICTDNGTSSTFHHKDIDNLIVIDHHPLNDGEQLDENITYILNPNLHRKDNLYYSTSGGKVAYDVCIWLDNFLTTKSQYYKHYLADVKNQETHRTFKEVLIEYASFTLISDMAVLDNKNRAFVIKGLKLASLKDNKMPLYLLFKGEFTQMQLSFKIISLINAMSRMDKLQDINPATGMTYMESFVRPRNYNEWRGAYGYIDSVNNQKKDAVFSITKDLLNKHFDDEAILHLINRDDIKIGIGGLIANKLQEAYRKPAIVGIVTTKKDKISFSARGKNVKNILKLLIGNSGGHNDACGGALEVTQDIDKHFKELQDRLHQINDEIKEINSTIDTRKEVICSSDTAYSTVEALKIGKAMLQEARGVEYYKSILVPIVNYKIVSNFVYTKGEYGKAYIKDVSQDDTNNDGIEIRLYNALKHPEDKLNSSEAMILEVNADGSFGIVETYNSIESMQRDTIQLKEGKKFGIKGDISISQNKESDKDIEEQKKNDIFKEEAKKEVKKTSIMDYNIPKSAGNSMVDLIKEKSIIDENGFAFIDKDIVQNKMLRNMVYLYIDKDKTYDTTTLRAKNHLDCIVSSDKSDIENVAIIKNYLKAVAIKRATNHYILFDKNFFTNLKDICGDKIKDIALNNFKQVGVNQLSIDEIMEQEMLNSIKKTNNTEEVNYAKEVTNSINNNNGANLSS